LRKLTLSENAACARSRPHFQRFPLIAGDFVWQRLLKSFEYRD
jgi:hypothetical protein